MRRQIAACVVPFLMAVAGCDRSNLPGPSPQPTSTGLNPPSPPQPNSDDADPLTGAYKLELTMDQIGDQCADVPQVVKHRTYNATIKATGNSNYVVSLSGGVFLGGPICTFAPAHLGCDQFPASRTGDALDFNLINENDDGHGGHIVERVPQAGWIEVFGSLKGAIDNGTISAKGSGGLWYCSSSAGYPFPCAHYVGCAVNDLRMTFARQ